MVNAVTSKLSTLFFPPELSETMGEGSALEGANLSGEMAALRRLYFSRQRDAHPEGNLDKKLVAQVIDHAKKIITHPTRRRQIQLESVSLFPYDEIELEESIEADPTLSDPRLLLVERAMDKPFSCVAILDASSSMSGDKHLLASIAVAVLLLHLPPKDSSVVLFASDAKEIKGLTIDETPEATMLRFLKSQARGFTNIAKGLEEGLKQYRRNGASKRKVGLIATDGRTTEGKDPLDVARRYDFLAVLHLHGPGSHLESSKQLAQAGHGICLEVEKFEEMPRRMYDALKRVSSV